jgi:hypothetical protein
MGRWRLRDIRDTTHNGARAPALKRAEAAMPDYQLYFLTPENHIVNHYSHAYRDDLRALDKARALSKDHAIEIWQDKRRVALVKMGDAALNAGDPSSL